MVIGQERVQLINNSQFPTLHNHSLCVWYVCVCTHANVYNCACVCVHDVLEDQCSRLFGLCELSQQRLGKPPKNHVHSRAGRLVWVDAEQHGPHPSLEREGGLPSGEHITPLPSSRLPSDQSTECDLAAIQMHEATHTSTHPLTSTVVKVQTIHSYIEHS